MAIDNEPDLDPDRDEEERADTPDDADADEYHLQEGET